MTTEVSPLSSTLIPPLTIYDKMAPLDLIFFSGTDLISIVVKDVEQLGCGFKDVSHVGIVVTSEILPSIKELVPGKKYIWESTSSLVVPCTGTPFVPDVERRTSRFGVQIRPLEDVVSTYDGKVYWAQLKTNPWLGLNTQITIISKVEQLHLSYKATHYESNPISLLSSAMRLMRPVRNLIDYTLICGHYILNAMRITSGPWTQLNAEELTVFCSEFVTIVYQTLDILQQDPSVVPYNTTPVNMLHAMPGLLNPVVSLK